MSAAERIDIQYPAITVTAHFGHGLPLEEFEAGCLRPLDPDRVCLISDANVFELHGHRLEAFLEGRGYRLSPVSLPPGERSKTLETAGEIYGYFCENGLTRRSVLVALGGGVVGDLAGFIAGTYMRGIPYLQVPTSLLAQVDSAIGGKVGVNHHCSKNLVGLFNHPAAIWLDTAFLGTLPAPEWENAFGEILKYALILDPGLLELLEEAESVESLRQSSGHVTEIVRRCLRAKIAIVEADCHETGPRKVLNFGHTLGHALESAGRYERFRHGQAVALGMLMAQRLGRDLGLVDEGWHRRSTEVIRRLLPPPALEGLQPEVVFSFLGSDKKRTSPGHFFVFSTGPGQYLFQSDVASRPVLQVLSDFLRQPSGDSR